MLLKPILAGMFVGVLLPQELLGVALLVHPLPLFLAFNIWPKNDVLFAQSIYAILGHATAWIAFGVKGALGWLWSHLFVFVG